MVLQTGSAVEMPWLGGVRACFENWYGGEQQGPAIASLLFGDVSPTGKLPMTFPASLADTPTNTPERYPGVFADGSTTRRRVRTEIRQVEYSEGLQVGYKWYQEQGIEPLFAFGHGLSYTTFSYEQGEGHAQVDERREGDPHLVQDHEHRRPGRHRDRAGVRRAPDSDGRAGHAAGRVAGRHPRARPARQRDDRPVGEDLAELHLLEYWNTAAEEWTAGKGTYGVPVGGSSMPPVDARSPSSSTTARRRRSGTACPAPPAAARPARRPSVCVIRRVRARCMITRAARAGPPARASRGARSRASR